MQSGQIDTKRYKKIAEKFLEAHPQFCEIKGLKRFFIRKFLVRPLSETPLGKKLDIQTANFYHETTEEAVKAIKEQGFKLGMPNKYRSGLGSNELGSAVYLSPEKNSAGLYGEKSLITKISTDNSKVGYVNEGFLKVIQAYIQSKSLKYLKNKTDDFMDVIFIGGKIYEATLPKLFKSLGYDAAYMPSTTLFGKRPQLAVFDPKKVQVIK
jgi:hypothetical protein